MKSHRKDSCSCKRMHWCHVTSFTPVNCDYVNILSVRYESELVNRVITNKNDIKGLSPRIVPSI